MAKRYQRDKQRLQIKGQTIQWPQDTDEINRSNKSKVRQYNGPTSISSFCLSRRYSVAIVLSDLRFVASLYFVDILWPLYCLTFEATRYQRDKQKLHIEGESIQWPQDTDEINRSCKSKVRQYNDRKIPTRCHCIV
jgi:hypothetical protein